MSKTTRVAACLLALFTLTFTACEIADIVLPGEILVQVTDADLNAVEGVEVSISPGLGSKTTDQNGTVMFSRLALAKYRLEAVHPLGFTAEGEVDLRRETPPAFLLLSLSAGLQPPTFLGSAPAAGSVTEMYLEDTLPVTLNFSVQTNNRYTFTLRGDRQGLLLDTTNFVPPLQFNLSGLPLGTHVLTGALINEQGESDELPFTVEVYAEPTAPRILSHTETEQGHRISWSPSTNRSFDHFWIETFYPEPAGFYAGTQFQSPTDTVFIYEDPPFGVDVSYVLKEQLTDHQTLVSDTVTITSDAAVAELPGQIVMMERHPSSGDLLVLTYEDHSLHFVDGETMQSTASVVLPSEPVDMAVDPATGEVYVTCQTSSNITVISLESRRITRSLPVPVTYGPGEGRLSYVDVLAAPYIAYSGFGKFDDAIVVAHKESGMPVDTLEIGYFQHHLAVGHDGRSIFVNRIDPLTKYTLQDGQLILAAERTHAVSGTASGFATEDGRFLIYEQHKLDPDDLDRYILVYPDEIQSISRNATVVAGHNGVYDGTTAAYRLSFPFYAWHAVLDVGGKFVYFTGTDEFRRGKVYRLPVPS